MSIFRLRNRPSFIIGALFFVYTLATFSIYLTRTLDGDINNHILAGDMWGTPKALVEKGIRPLYHGEGVTGWDGQFYYYIANDPLAEKDTPSHIDSPAYRYQRLGLSLYTRIVATLIGKDWVSPALFITSYFFLIFVATILGGKLLQYRNVNPFLILLWGLSPGTQITLFNALPDAAADSFLIIGLYLLSTGWLRVSSLPFIFAALSREVYVIFPIAIWSSFAYFNFIQPCHAKYTKYKQLIFSSYGWLLSSPLAFLLWQVYLTIHFGNTPSSQAAGILGLPFVAWSEYFISGISGNHNLVGIGFSSYAESASLILFLLIDVLAFVISFHSLGKFFKSRDSVMTGLTFATLALAMLYACFGSTVMMHYTGYAKAMPVLILMILLLGCRSSEYGAYLHRFSYLVVLVAVVFISYYNFKVRIFPKNDYFDSYTNMSRVKRDNQIQCIDEYNVAIRVKDLQILGSNRFARLFSDDQKMVLLVELTNLGATPLVSTRNLGSVHMSAQWLDINGDVVEDGVRTALLDPLEPGKKTVVSVVMRIPKISKNLRLQISPVQEGCAWFYKKNPNLVSGELLIVR